MRKSTFTPLYESLRAKLVEIRKAAGLTQRDLAERLGRERSFVGRIELGERRLDLVEFHWVCRACGQDSTKVAAELLKEFSKLEPPATRQRRLRRKSRQQ